MRETLGNHPKFVIPRVDRAVVAAALDVKTGGEAAN
jgi:hypothetical protein